MKRFAIIGTFVLATAELGAIGCNAVLGNADGILLPDGSTTGLTCAAGQKACGTCVDTSDPKVGCGGACTVCDTPDNAQSLCALDNNVETCSLGPCNPQFGNCDNNATNGCETHTTTKENCGTCGKTCAPLPYCEPGGGGGYICSSTCDAPNIVCPGDAGTECIDKTTDNGNCGGCGIDCTVKNGSGVCTSGKCKVTCQLNYFPCGNKCILPSNTECGASCAPCTDPQTCDTVPGDPGYGTCVSPSGSGDSGGPPGCTNGGCGTACTLCDLNATCQTSGTCACNDQNPVVCTTPTTPADYWCCPTDYMCGGIIDTCMPPTCTTGTACVIGASSSGCCIDSICQTPDKTACGSSCKPCGTDSCCCPGGGGGPDSGLASTYLCETNTDPDAGCNSGCN